VLQSGFSTLKQIAADKFLIFYAYPAAMFPSPKLDNVSILRKPHVPLLIVHGTLDMTIPVSHARRLYKLASEPKRYVELPHSGHWVDEKDHDQYMAAMRDFLASLPAGSSAAGTESKPAVSLQTGTQR
jgi:pimeloyl-ACP methyl ester carboxylesterase